MNPRLLKSAVRAVLLAFLIPAAFSQGFAHDARLRLVAVEYRDLDGDGDRFPDTGETGRLLITIENQGASLANPTFYLATDDPGVACLTVPLLTLAGLPAGTTTIGSLDPALPGFTFKVGDSFETTYPADPERIEFCLHVKADGTPGLFEALCFDLLADLDLPETDPGTLIAGPDGVAGTSDDGLLLETFDTDRDGDGLNTVRDTFRLLDAGTGAFSSGSYLRAGGPSTQGGILGGVACGGYRTADEGNIACTLDPDHPMDWHLHCPPGAANCPNLETGACVGGCSYATPANGRLALSPPNSLHMGAHFDLDDRTRGDTTHLRALQAFVSAPINLTLFPRPGDLQMSMFHIARLMDHNGISGGVWVGIRCFDCGDVQIQVDANADPAVDEWGVWDKLVPYYNVYDHKPAAWSVFSYYYCLFTPSDSGTEPPAPRGVHETICTPQGAWSSCGSVHGTSSATTFQCPGPGQLDPSGTGVWVESKFNLAGYIGQRVRIRWIGASWVFDHQTSSYYEYGGSWGASNADDGWWLDDIRVTGALTRQTTFVTDTRPPPGGACPDLSCAPVPPGIMAWWPLDGDGSDIAGGFDGTLNGGAYFVPGFAGGAAVFDGWDDSMTTPLIVGYSGGVTFAAWIRTLGRGGAVSTGHYYWYGRGTAVQLTRGEVEFLGTATQYQGDSFRVHGGYVSDGHFHHVAATWTGDTTSGGVRLYIDGALLATGTALQAIEADELPMRLGQLFDGAIDDFVVIGRPLTAEEVRSLAAAGPQGWCRSEPCVDGDGDGYGQAGNLDCPAGRWSDCDDADPAVHRGATEVCDGIDNNCDFRVDDLGRSACGVGACFREVQACVEGEPQACVPGDPTPEICNDIDDDCDGLVDNAPDVDGDGVGPCAGDCDDLNPAVYPGATEVCDEFDNDCDTRTDDLGETRCGIGACTRTVQNCVDGVSQTCVPGAPSPETCDGVDDDCDGLVDNAPDVDGDGHFPCAGDCNDSDPAVHPGAAEVCDGIDNDCDTVTDDLGQTTCGVGACTRTVLNCAGGVSQTCVPGVPSPETCNGVDDDCDGSTPEGDVDADGDGWPICAGDCDDNDPLVHPGTQEANDGIDNDCPGAPGYGLVDDVGDIRFVSQGRLCWPAQSGATLYDVARGGGPDLTGSCVVVSVASNCLDDPSPPPGAHYYLVRARGPFTGSWGADSAGNERIQVCGQ